MVFQQLLLKEISRKKTCTSLSTVISVIRHPLIAELSNVPLPVRPPNSPKADLASPSKQVHVVDSQTTELVGFQDESKEDVHQ